MQQYFQYDVFGSGYGMLLFAVMIIVWLIGIVCLLRRNHQVATGMVELIWLIAPLRATLNTCFSFGCASYIAGQDSIILLLLRNLGLAVTIPFIDATILSLCILIPLMWARQKRPIECHCIVGILAAISSVMITYYTWIRVLTW